MSFERPSSLFLAKLSSKDDIMKNPKKGRRGENLCKAYGTGSSFRTCPSTSGSLMGEPQPTRTGRPACARSLAHVLRRPSYVWPRSSDAKLRCSYLLEITELMRAAEWNPVGPGTSLCCPRERDAAEETLTGGREKRRRQLGARRASHCNSSILSLKSKNISIHEAAER